MEGGNLTQALENYAATNTRLTEPQISYIMLQSLKALSFIHSVARIHRDIKSDNLLMGAKGEVKIADFGNAVQLGSEDEKRSTMCGSPYWMAPEIINGKQYGREVDIWSLGIMLMECCDLQPPYILEPPSTALYLISSKPVPPLREADMWSAELKQFLSLCLQRDPNKRPQAIELLQHPFLHRACSSIDFLEVVFMDRRKKKDPCSVM